MEIRLIPAPFTRGDPGTPFAFAVFTIMSTGLIEGRRIRLRGTVQGVGMRPWVYRLAREHGVAGHVCNEPTGVTIDAFAAPDALSRFLDALRRDIPPAAAIDSLESQEIAPADTDDFVIIESQYGDGRRVSIPPDLATCDECAAEIFDPADRRYRYPFTNCTNCGPRFTIATDVPYDRPATTMGAFGMCAECQREYDDPADRRFHAQPNACPACGPRLTALDPDGHPLDVDDAVGYAAEQIVAGGIVAVKGLGGFHLACDATSAHAVARLRTRKRRDEKPFAVMVRDLADAEKIVEVADVARALLMAPERPIVLLPRRDFLPPEGGSHTSGGDDLPPEGGSHTSRGNDLSPEGGSHTNRGDDLPPEGGSHTSRRNDLSPEGGSHTNRKNDVPPRGGSLTNGTDCAEGLWTPPKGSPIAAEVAPLNPLLGVMLPYTPLHHLLLAACGRPLVMTSANVSEEPIAYRNDEAVQRLRSIADLLLVHDREIVTRCDDSVIAIVAKGPTVLRRSRGYVPRAIQLRDPVDAPVLATGALLKNTFCLARGDQAWLGPHIGDLENVETFAAFEQAIERMERFLGFRGEVIAHDLHPDYMSTRYAVSRASSGRVAVQHHHAHIASAMAEHGLSGPVIGVAFDGTGYGGATRAASSATSTADPSDGTAWGGEFMVATASTAERVATFRPLPLAGGDAAIRQPWRIALAATIDAFGSCADLDSMPLFRQVCATDQLVVGQMLAGNVNCPPARGVGRYFDAFAALAFSRPRATYEGQLALEFNMAAEPGEAGSYAFALDRSREPLEIDLRPAWRSAFWDVRNRVPASIISARFHNTLVQATASVVRHVVHEYGTLPVVLTGGCFQNARLSEGVVAALGSRVDVHLHRRVPPGDGGIALGQVFVAGRLVS